MRTANHGASLAPAPSMTRHTILLALLFTTSLAHAHEIETHVSGYGLGPFGLNVDLELSERATFTIGIEGFYASSQAEGFSASRIGGAGIPIGFKIHLTDPTVGRAAPHVRMMGIIGARGEVYEGTRSAVGIFGAFGGVGATYYLRDTLGLGTEAGVGFASYHGPESDDHVVTFTWRMTLIFRFGDSLANPHPPEDPHAESS